MAPGLGIIVGIEFGWDKKDITYFNIWELNPEFTESRLVSVKFQALGQMTWLGLQSSVNEPEELVLILEDTQKGSCGGIRLCWEAWASGSPELPD